MFQRLDACCEYYMKIDGVVVCVESGLKQWSGLGMLVKWAVKRQMEIDPDNCKMLHFGGTYEAKVYTMNCQGSIDEQQL